MKLKAVIIVIIAALLIGAGLWLFIPRTETWDETVRCYDLSGVDFSLSDDTELDGIEDYIDVNCAFKVVHSPIIKTGIEGSIDINGREYAISTISSDSDNVDWTVAVSFKNSNAVLYLWLSKDRRYIEVTELNGESNISYISSGNNTLGDLKTAANSFGFDLN